MGSSQNFTFAPTAHRMLSSGYGLGGPDLDNRTWFRYSIGFLLTVLVPGWFVVFFGLSWDAATGWAASRCWGCNAWPELSNPGRLDSGRLPFSKEAIFGNRGVLHSSDRSQDLLGHKKTVGIYINRGPSLAALSQSAPKEA